MQEDKNSNSCTPAAPAPSTSHKWQESWAKKADEQELLELFKESFGHAMAEAQWRWKYSGDQPLGVCIRKQGTIIAFYGGLPREMRFLGDKIEAVQICDVMVAPNQRGVFTRRGALYYASLTFTEDLLGPGRKFFCGFGFPSERHHRMGELYGMYTRIDGMLEATWSPVSKQLDLVSSTVLLVQPSMDLLPSLWQLMAEDLKGKVVLERDIAYIQMRFFEHPTIEYLPLLVKRRFSNKPLGLLILRDHGPRGVELVDLIGPLVHMPALVRAAQRFAGGLQSPCLFAWLTGSVAEVLKETQPRLEDLKIPVTIALPASVSAEAVNISDTRGQWWLIGGDTDFR